MKLKSDTLIFRTISEIFHLKENEHTFHFKFCLVSDLNKTFNIKNCIITTSLSVLFNKFNPTFLKN